MDNKGIKAIPTMAKITYLENAQPSGLKTFFVYLDTGKYVAAFNKPVAANFTRVRARNDKEAIAAVKEAQMDVLLSPVVD